MFYHLTERKTCLIPVDCPTHILHNTAEKETERLSVDIETIVLKIGSLFKSKPVAQMASNNFVNNWMQTIQLYQPIRRLDGLLWMLCLSV